ncbi:MAG: tetraacyldisaccharide 4'-kinase [Proteobacteria bacterium]|nr:tetraacyldisaccharide 4'-kinase [Pseudomonadota bacterium]
MEGDNRNGIERIMRSEKKGVIHTLLSPLSALYGAVVSTRSLLYKTGLYKINRLPCKVISIGNITVGGSGKTPMTIFVAERLTSFGFNVVVLSRGYGRSTTGTQVVSDTESILLDAKEAGDEPYLMAERLSGIPVVVGEKRYEAGVEIMELFNPDILLLDDGFQHISLARDLNILLIDSTTGFGSGLLLPTGILREPVGAAARADLVMVKGAAGLGPKVTELMAPLNKEEICFEYAIEDFTIISKIGTADAAANQAARVLALAALANPGSFISTIESLGLEVGAKRLYRDHHGYTKEDLAEIYKTAEGLDAIVTTEKDAVKLKALLNEESKEAAEAHPPVYTLRIGAEVSDPERFDYLLKSVFTTDNGTL